MQSFDFFPVPFFVGLIVLALAVTRSRRGWLDRLGLALFGLYLMAAAAVILFPIIVPENWPAQITWENFLNDLNHVNLVPFRFGSLFDANPVIVIQQLAGNILLTIPFGFFICLLYRLDRKRVLYCAFGAGLALEGMQFVLQLLQLSYRSVDINDVILNALGVLIGAGAYSALQWMVQQTRIEGRAA